MWKFGNMWALSSWRCERSRLNWDWWGTFNNKMLIKRLEFLTLRPAQGGASDLIAQRDFYSTVLELSTRIDNDSLHIQAGKTDLIFKQVNNFQGAYHFCFNIPENKFTESKKWISEKTPLLKDDKGKDEFPSDSWNSTSLYFEDSAGNILELYMYSVISTMYKWQAKGNESKKAATRRIFGV